jgi:nucleoside-diphosphate-sugar epimerase
VLVTGATSMIGRHVVDRLVERGDEVTVTQRRSSGRDDTIDVLGDLADPETAIRATEGIEGVIHLAARVGVTGNWSDFRAANVDASRHLLEAARHHQVRRFVHVSTPSAAHAGASLVGVGAGPADADRARGHYARSKAQAEQLALAASSEEFPVVALRPHLVFGPGDTQLVQRVIDRARSGRLALVGSGLALIDTTWVGNAADAMVAALDRADVAAGRALVVSNGQPRTVTETIQRILVAAGAPTSFRRVPTTIATAVGAVVDVAWERLERDDDPPITRFLAEQLSTAHWFDQRETRTALQWSPRVGLDEAFALLAQSFET